MNITDILTLRSRLSEHNRTRHRRQDGAWLRLVLAIGLLAIVTGFPVTPPARAELGVDSPLYAQQRARYKKAFVTAKAGKISSAHRMLAGEKSELARKLATWLYYTRSSKPAAFPDVVGFIQNNADWPQQRALRRAAEAAITAKTAPDQILGWFGKNPPVSVEARVRLADAFFASGQPNLGEVLVRKIWINDNLSRAVERRFYRKYRDLLTRDDHVLRLDRLLWDLKRGPANRMLSRVPPDYRKLGFARLSLIGSAVGVDSAIAKVPPHLIDHPALRYERIHCRRTKGFHESAREFLWKPPQQLGRPEKWWRERRLQVRRLLRKGHISEAYRMAAAHGQIARAQIAEAEWLAGWIALSFLKDANSALGHFARGHEVVRFPISVARMAYWAGRAAQVSDRRDIADRWYAIATRYPMTFYGQLAIARFDKPVALTLPSSPTPSARDAKGFRRHEIVRAIKL